MAKKENNTAETEEIKETSEDIAENEQDDSTNQQIKELEEKCKDLSEKYMRVLAEYDNYRKRTIKEKESIYPEAKAVVVEKFLPVLDNLDRALLSAENKDPLYEGVSLVKKQMEEVLTSIGVEAIDALNTEFNPELHDAVMHIDDENAGENIIVEEFQKGYRMGERVIRHSMVKVAN